MQNEEVLNKLQEMVQLWHSKDIFGPQIGDRLQKCLTTHKKLLSLQEMFPTRSEIDLQSALEHCKESLDTVAEYFAARDCQRADSDAGMPAFLFASILAT